MLPAMTKRLRIVIIGPGRLGRALAVDLTRAGHKVVEIVSRSRARSRRHARELARAVGARAATGKTAGLDADLIWLCVPDREIASAAQELADIAPWQGKIVFHSSGALGSDELGALRRRGARVAAVHPFMTFVSKAIPELRGVPFGIEGDDAATRMARQVVRGLGGQAFSITKQKKAVYHAWGAFTSPLLVSLLVTAERVAAQAGFSQTEARRWALPIVQQTIANYARLGPAGAFSGPIIRGDAAVVRKHLRALKKIPAAGQVYAALAQSALRNLPARNRRELQRALVTRPKE